MVSHHEYLDLISAAVDGSLTPGERAGLEAHLAQCPDCRQLYEDFSALHAALGDLPAPDRVPEDLTKRIMEQVEGDNVIPFAPKKPAAWTRWGASAAAIALVVAGGRLVWLRQQTSADTASPMARSEAVTAGDAAEKGSTPETASLFGAGTGEEADGGSSSAPALYSDYADEIPAEADKTAPTVNAALAPDGLAALTEKYGVALTPDAALEHLLCEEDFAGFVPLEEGTSAARTPEEGGREELTWESEGDDGSQIFRLSRLSPGGEPTPLARYTVPADGGEILVEEIRN